MLNVNSSHIREVVKGQKDLDLKLAPKIDVGDFTPGKFGKLKVNRAINLFSRNVSASLKLLPIEHNQEDYVSTRFYVDTVSEGFSLVTSHSMNLVLGVTDGNEISQNKYSETIVFLESIFFKT